MSKVRVLAARPGLRVCITDAQGHPLRGSQGAICVTDAGLLMEHSGEVRHGPVEVDDSLYLRDQIACGDLKTVPEATQPPRAGRAKDKE